MKRIILSLFIIFGISSHCFGANNATDVYLLAQTKNATELKNVENIDVVIQMVILLCVRQSNIMM